MYTEWLDTLIKVRLFEGIEEDELNKMLMCLSPKIVSYKKREYLTIVGNEFSGIGVVLKGKVNVTKENVAGNKIIMAKLNKGDIFGEIVAFSHKNEWVATVIASTKCTIMFLPSDKIVGNCPKMCVGHKLLIQNMIKIVSCKAIKLNRKVEYLTIKSIRAKISTYLLEQFRINGKSTFNIPFKRYELAEFLNVSRPSLSREMSKMKDQGIIDFYKSSFKIIDIEKLKALV